MPQVQIRNYKSGFRTYLNDTPVSRKPVDLKRAVQQKNALARGGKAEEVRNYALSKEDILSMIPTLKIITYPQLHDYDNIDDALDEKGRLLILYLTEDEHTGHWVCLLKRRNTNTIEYFDPYGNYKPDEEGKWLSPQDLKRFKQDSKYLTELLGRSKYRVVYNKVPFQTEHEDVNTCGRHCVTRLYFKHLPLNKYTEMIMNSGTHPDDFVSGFTYHLINK